MNFAWPGGEANPQAGFVHDEQVYPLAEVLGDKPFGPIGSDSLPFLQNWRERLANDLDRRAVEEPGLPGRFDHAAVVVLVLL